MEHYGYNMNYSATLLNSQAARRQAMPVILAYLSYSNVVPSALHLLFHKWTERSVIDQPS